MNILSTLAERAVRQPPARGSGRYHYVRTQGWYLHTDQTTSGRVLDWRIEPTSREFWVAEDGSGRIAETRDGRVSRASGTYGPSELHGALVTGDSAESLQAHLVEHNPTRSPLGWLKLTQELWTNQVVSPALQAAMLRILATQPGITAEGTVTDRAGRPGIAFSAQGRTAPDAPATRYVLILNPDTGTFLDFEQIAVEPGGLPIKAPATTSYTVWLDAGHTPDTTTRP